jgi:hypothetical protein
VWSCVGFCDTEGLTRIDPNVYRAHHSHNKGNRSALYREFFRQGDGLQLRNNVVKLWQYICEQADDEVIRSLLFRAWLYLFGHNLPACLVRKEADTEAMVQSIKRSLWEGSDVANQVAALFKQDRLTVRDPFESHNKCEMILRHGRSFRPAAATQESNSRSRHNEKLIMSSDHKKSNKVLTLQPTSRTMNTAAVTVSSESKLLSPLAVPPVATDTGLKLSLSFKPSAAKQQQL